MKLKIQAVILLASTFLLTGCIKTEVVKVVDPASIDMEQAITSFEEDNMRKINSWFDSGKPICASDVLLIIDGDTPKERIAFTGVECLNVVKKNGDLYSTSGFGGAARLYKLENNNGNWKVLDYDDRMFPGTEPKPWVKKYSDMYYKEMGKSFDRLAVTDKLTQRAGQIIGVVTPKPIYRSCKSNNDCTNSEVCAKAGGYQFIKNTCMQKCSTHEDCGKGYSCRMQCVNGENGCPKTGVNICIPDIPADTLDKVGQPW